MTTSVQNRCYYCKGKYCKLWPKFLESFCCQVVNIAVKLFRLLQDRPSRSCSWIKWLFPYTFTLKSSKFATFQQEQLGILKSREFSPKSWGKCPREYETFSNNKSINPANSKKIIFWTRDVEKIAKYIAKKEFRYNRFW